MHRSLATSWAGVDATADRAAQAVRLRRLYDAFHEGRDVHRHVRAIVTESWARSAAAGLDPSSHRAAIVVDEPEIEERWRTHPLFESLPSLRELLSAATAASRHILVISDAHGVLLWIEGHRHVIEATEEMHFVRGADWSEAGAGTNALGTAIAVGHPVQIFSAEHFSRVVHPWQCSGAPIRDPTTGELLGVLDLTGPLRTGHPHTLSLVTAAASAAEAILRERRRWKDERRRDAYLTRIAGKRQPTALVRRGGQVIMAVPRSWAPATVSVPRGGGEIVLPDGRSAVAEPLPGGDAFILWGPPRRRPARFPAEEPARLRLKLLATPPTAVMHGQALELSRRHAEILALLLLSPRGLTSDELALELYGASGKSVTVRAELSRLRRLIGGVIDTRPYRLRRGVSADVLDIERLLAEGRAAEALARYSEPLLDRSRVDLIVNARQALDEALRQAALRSLDAELVLRWCATSSGRQDQQAAELLLRLLPPADRRYATAARRLARLRGGAGGSKRAGVTTRAAVGRD